MKQTNLSQFDITSAIKKALRDRSIKIGIVVSEWNENITNALKEGALTVLKEAGIASKNIITCSVPGSFELPMGASMLMDSDEDIDSVICLGCIIQGETRHFEFIAQAVASEIIHLSHAYAIPVIFGVLTCDTMEQAQERAGGKHGNKGVEAAHTCLKMIELQQRLLLS